MRTGGAFRGNSRPAAVRAAIALVALLIAFGASACGNSADGPEPAEPPDNIVSRSEVDRQSRGGVERAFLEYWSALQYQAWAEAVSFYDPSFRDAVGTTSIIGAKKVNAPSYPNLKPSIVEVTRRGDLATVRYTLWLSDGTKERASATWRKDDGNWQLVHDSRLDAELNQFAQNQVEIEKNGALPTSLEDVSPDAARAGHAAAERQARFLRDFDLSS